MLGSMSLKHSLQRAIEWLLLPEDKLKITPARTAFTSRATSRIQTLFLLFSPKSLRNWVFQASSFTMVYSHPNYPEGHPSNLLKAPASSKNDPRDPLSVAPADFARDLKINTTSAFVAAQQAVLGFEKLPDSASKTFIYTGNILNTTTIPQLLTLGVGKSATAHIIQSAAAAYSDRGFK